MACRWSAACSPAASRRGATCSHWARRLFLGQRARRAPGTEAGIASARVLPHGARGTMPIRASFASPSTAMRCCFSDEAEARLPARRPACLPRTRGRPGQHAPAARAVQACCWRCGGCAVAAQPAGMGVRTALVTARSAPGARAGHPHADGLAHRDRRGDVPGRAAKGEFLRAFEPRISSSTTRPATSKGGGLGAGRACGLRDLQRMTSRGAARCTPRHHDLGGPPAQGSGAYRHPRQRRSRDGSTLPAPGGIHLLERERGDGLVHLLADGKRAAQVQVVARAPASTPSCARPSLRMFSSPTWPQPALAR